MHFNTTQHLTNGFTPVKMHHMKVINSPLCTFCTLKDEGTYLHMIWECSPVCQFWNKSASKLSALINDTIPVTISVLILNDLSAPQLSNMQKHAVFAGLTAAKKMMATRWKPPHDLSIRTWTLSFLDVI